jgi:hypothetical protein
MGTKRGDFILFVDDSAVQGLFARLEASIMPTSLFEFMEAAAWPMFSDRIMDRFAYEGDSASGTWPDLSPATVAIKEKLGVDFPDAPNVRTGEMLEFLTHSHHTMPTEGGVEMVFPVDTGDAIMTRKIQVAQGGDPGPNWLNEAMAPTPARPVIAIDEVDMASLLKALSIHVITAVMSGGTFVRSAA